MVWTREIWRRIATRREGSRSGVRCIENMKTGRPRTRMVLSIHCFSWPTDSTAVMLGMVKEDCWRAQYMVKEDCWHAQCMVDILLLFFWDGVCRIFVS